MNKAKVVMIIGGPAAGKSTQSELFIKQDYIYLNRDSCGGKVIDLLPKMENTLKVGNNVILDNLFPTIDSRKPFIDLAKSLSAEISCLHINTSIEDCQINLLNRMYKKYKKLFNHPDDIKADASAKKDPNVYPIAVLFKYRKEFETPTINEGFSSVTEVDFKRIWGAEFSNKALILDYDDTLRTSTGIKQYPINPSDIQILPNRKEKIQKYKDDGYLLLGVSNQSGIHKGILSYDDAVACFEKTNELLGFDIHYTFCPHQSNPPVCFCRKPQSSNGVYLINKYKLNPSQCIFVGDQTSDKTFANRVGFKYYDVSDFFES